MAGVDPAQKLDVFGQGRPIARRGPDEVADAPAEEGQHLREVGDRRTVVRQRRLQPLDETRPPILSQWPEPGLDHRKTPTLDLHHRVHHGVHVGAGLGDLAHDAVDQERRVGLDDLEPLESEVAAIRAHGPLESHGQGFAARQRARTPERGERRAEIGRRKPRQFPRAEIVEDVTEKGVLLGGRAGVCPAQGGDERTLQLLEGDFVVFNVRHGTV